MKFRKLGNTQLEVSEIGVGISGLVGESKDDVFAYVEKMGQLGINFIDLSSHDADTCLYLGRAIMGKRDDFIVQAHIGSVWKDGSCHSTRNIPEAEKAFSQQLKQLATGHVDIGILHDIVDEDDLMNLMNGDLKRFTTNLKAIGAVRAIGASTANLDIAHRIMEEMDIDVLMLDLGNLNDEDISLEERSARIGKVAAQCREKGVGIIAANTHVTDWLSHAQVRSGGESISVKASIDAVLAEDNIACVISAAGTTDELVAAALFVS